MPANPPVGSDPASLTLFFTVTRECNPSDRGAIHKGGNEDYWVHIHSEKIDREPLTMQDNFSRYAKRLRESLLWEHKKGGRYHIVGIAYDLQLDELGVVYQSTDRGGPWFFRPFEGLQGFFSTGRFSPVGRT